MVPGQAYLLKIYLAEGERYQGLPLFEWIIREAKHVGLAGASVFKGVEGFGATREIHTTRILRLSEKLPVLIEIVDKIENIDNFIPIIEPVIGEGMVTVQKIDIRVVKIKGQEV